MHHVEAAEEAREDGRRRAAEECRCAAARARLEKIAGYYLIQHDEVDISVSFDVLSLLVVSKDRAFMKTWRDAFQVDGCSGCCGCF